MLRRPVLVLVAALGCAIAVLHSGVLLGGTFGLRDHLTYTVPSRAHLHAALTAGRFPEWWPQVGLGIPFAANPVHQAFAPVGLVCALLPMPLGADLEVLAYLLVMAVGAALLSVRFGASVTGGFLAGALLAASGYVGSLIVNGNLPHIAWIPWLVWSGDRLAAACGQGWRSEARAAVVLAAFGALQCIGPEPAAAITGALLTLVVVLARTTSRPRGLAWLAAAGAAAVGLAAVTLVPALELGARTARRGGLDFPTAAEWSLHPVRLVELVWPHALGDPIGARSNLTQLFSEGRLRGQEPAWSYSLFLGAPVLLLAIVGAVQRGARWLLVAALASTVLALGHHTPAFDAVRTVFPPERYLRYPEKHVIGAVVVLSVLAGVGFQRLLAEVPSRRALRIAFAGAIALTIAVGALGVSRASVGSALARAGTAAGAVDVQAGLAAASRGGWVAVLGAWAVVAAIAGLRNRPRLAAAVVALGCLGPLAWNTRSLSVLVPREDVQRPPPMVAAIRAADASPRPRMLLPEEMTWTPVGRQDLARQNHRLSEGNVGTRFGVQVLPGVEPTFDLTYRYFWGDQFGAMPLYGFATLFGVRWLALDEFRYPQPFPGPVIAREPPLNVVDLAPVRPRAFVAGDFGFVRTADDALPTLAAPGRAEHPSAVILAAEGAPEPLVRPGGAPGPCSVREDLPERVALECDAPAGGYAVLLDGAAPGWTAEVDGAPAAVLTADALFRAVPVAPGPHRVTFRYRTPGLFPGLAISTATLAGVIALWIASRRRGAR